MKALSAGVVAGILIAEVAVAALLAYLYFRGDLIVFEYPTDLAAISLTAAGVIVTIAMLFIALFAIYGIREMADRAAAAGRNAGVEFLETPEFKAMVYRAASDAVRNDLESGVDTDKNTDLTAKALMSGDGDDGA
ncbi:hypothetical protein [Thalassobaculum sp.]|uniref:hypothetical protein n=1 Tax=Thalassobaculum sp. TaxID=2022740 RepID=UPI0032EE6E69